MSTAIDEIKKLGLNEFSLAVLPRLEVKVSNGQGEVIGHVETQLTALIVSPLNHVLYLEAACTSDSGAHALMGAVSDPRGVAEFRFFQPGKGDEYTEIHPPDSAMVNDVRLAVTGWSRHVHHVAMLDRSGELLLAPDDETLWRKLREKMSCPTLSEWGTAVMPDVKDSGLLLECETYGIPEGYKAFVLAPDAEPSFDDIIAAHVRVVGLCEVQTASPGMLW